MKDSSLNMKNDIATLDHLNFTVSDFEESVDYYKSRFGFSLVEKGTTIEDRPWGILKAGETMLAISEQPDLKKLMPEDHHRINHFGFRLSDENAWLETLDEFNMKTYYGSPVRYPNSTSWYVSDPNGYTIEVSIWKNNEVKF